MQIDEIKEREVLYSHTKYKSQNGRIFVKNQSWHSQAIRNLNTC